jgi:protein-S-isoprenylcysteine O-methyltransferase Ste14
MVEVPVCPHAVVDGLSGAPLSARQAHFTVMKPRGATLTHGDVFGRTDLHARSAAITLLVALDTLTVEIQEGQKLIDTGAYAVVRHPMYLAFAVLFCVAPIVLGSLLSLIPVMCIPFILALRIDNEESMLKKGLAGYDLYMKRVRYRLIPFVW